MNYISTRGKIQPSDGVQSADAIKQGLASDGGLFLPETISQIGKYDLVKLTGMSYAQRAAFLMGKFLTDYDPAQLLADCTAAYHQASFPGGAAPLYPLNDTCEILELWHGPTCAFKDMALQIMPRLLSRALQMTGETKDALILVATSGDTGKAALEGYRDIDRIQILVFYPVNGVSRMQKQQMITQGGDNVRVCAINGNFDDAQNGVKAIFSDPNAAVELAKNNKFFSSANSINFGRLAPQIVYYFSAYADLMSQNKLQPGDPINVCVPTGNFGNIFAAYIAKMMGLPIAKFICASNQNNILTDFFRTGVYDRNRPFHTTMSPSMDILISSNLERYLFVKGGAARTSQYMRDLKETGKYTVDPALFAEIQQEFFGYYCDEAHTRDTIRHTWEEHKYLIDPHTAVAVNCAEQYIEQTGDHTKTVIASTASPYKFPANVLSSLGKTAPQDEFEALDMLHTATGTPIPLPLSSLRDKAPRFEDVIAPNEMLQYTLSAFQS